jgi:Holliday junction DNA helicase RuvA
MIGRISGTVEYKKAPEVLIDVNGVGYEIQMPITSICELPELGEPVIIHTHLMIKEDNHTLFGFVNKSEREMFRELIKTSGVGGKMALNILSTYSSNEFLKAINNSDVNGLTKIPKVGKKMAERLLIEMRGRLKNISIEDNFESTSKKNTKEDAVSGLVALGYNSKQAKEMVESVYDESLTSDKLIKEALRNAL